MRSQQPGERYGSDVQGPHYKETGDKLIADSKEAAAKNLPPERQAACAERQASATPRKIDVSSTSMSTTLYPDLESGW